MSNNGRKAGHEEADRRMAAWRVGKITKKPSKKGWKAVARRVWYTTPAYQEETGAFGDTGHNDWEYGFMRGYQEKLEEHEAIDHSKEIFSDILRAKAETPHDHA